MFISLAHLQYGIDYINRDNFLNELDNGVVLCHLAQVICESAKRAIGAGFIKGVCVKIMFL
ncbi:hypothetical protein NQ314_005118 [Rhamnusium bicolor]|uniref:Calponin-homology (CH) domain-containing protein n=1 Tax=Rhamnusium bicolor TaxID=1586634 RepID=A0AAV8ZHT9_9CUCU|nr:hypothetical protein NQ314_005118 [Rhamnusium bicolor]